VTTLSCCQPEHYDRQAVYMYQHHHKYHIFISGTVQWNSVIAGSSHISKTGCLTCLVTMTTSMRTCWRMTKWTRIVQTNVVSVVKAPANRNSPLVSTQYMRCGEGRDHGAGRLIIVRKIYSLPTAGGNSQNGESLKVDEWLECGWVDSTSSSDIDMLDCCTTTNTYTGWLHFWISLSPRPNFGLRPNLIQKVKWRFWFGLSESLSGNWVFITVWLMHVAINCITSIQSLTLNLNGQKCVFCSVNNIATKNWTENNIKDCKLNLSVSLLKHSQISPSKNIHTTTFYATYIVLCYFLA